MQSNVYQACSVSQHHCHCSLTSLYSQDHNSCTHSHYLIQPHYATQKSTWKLSEKKKGITPKIILRIKKINPFKLSVRNIPSWSPTLNVWPETQELKSVDASQPWLPPTTCCSAMASFVIKATISAKKIVFFRPISLSLLPLCFLCFS